jgi:hypothetical protein
LAIVVPGDFQLSGWQAIHALNLFVGDVKLTLENFDDIEDEDHDGDDEEMFDVEFTDD